MTRILKTLLTCGTLLAAAGLLNAQQLSTKRTLNLEIAKRMVAAAEAEARKNNFTMFICVVDDGGNVMFIERMDDAQLGSFEVSMEKAKSALLFKRPTKAFEDVVAGGRVAVMKLPGALPVEGGIPLMADGKIIGAIGVSGGTSPQDAQVAQAGVAALEGMLKGGK
jgi:glc operon protein GlcG